MSDVETRLSEALKADAPALLDPLFRIRVMLRREQAVLRRRVAISAALSLIVAVVESLGVGTLGQGPGALVAVTAATVVPAAVLMAIWSSTPGGFISAAEAWRLRALACLQAVARPLLWR